MRVYYASPHKLEPAVLDTIKSVRESLYPDLAIQIAPIAGQLPPKATVLAFGPYEPKGDERVVYAPSGPQILTKPDIYTRLTQVFKLLVEPPVLPEFRYEVITDKESLIDLLEHTRGKEIVMDTEVGGVVDEDEPDPSKFLAVSFTTGGVCYVIPEELATDFQVYTALTGFVDGNATVWVNMKFDLRYFPPNKERTANDPQLAYYSLYPAAGDKGLKPVAKAYFGFPDWDESTKKYRAAKVYKEEWYDEETGAYAAARKYPAGSGFERIPRELLYKYAAYDVYATYHWWQLEKPAILADTESLEVYRKRVKLSHMFMEIERKGYTIDRPYVEQLRKTLEAERVVLWQELEELAGGPINPNSHVQVKAWFVDNDKALPKRKNSKGKMEPSSSEDALKDVINKGAYSLRAVRFAEKLLECRGNTKSLGTYVIGFLEKAKGNTIHATFNITGPLTGRLANRGKGAILTMPRDKRYRKMVVPSGEGRVLVKPDYGQLEMRIVAALSNDKRFISAFQPGSGDFFVSMMPEVYPHVDFSGMTEDGMKASPLRNGVKPISHGANYGRSPQAIAKQLGMDAEEAQAIFDRYMGPYGEGLRAWQDEIKFKAVNNIDIVTPYGFHLQSELVTDKNRSNVENSALAFLPQSTGNDMCLAAALRIHEWLPQYDAWIVATIHDQIIVDAPIQHAKETGQRMEEEMVAEGRNIFGDLLVFEAEPEYGFNWAEKMSPDDWDTWLTQNGYAPAA